MISGNQDGRLAFLKRMLDDPDGVNITDLARRRLLTKLTDSLTLTTPDLYKKFLEVHIGITPNKFCLPDLENKFINQFVSGGSKQDKWKKFYAGNFTLDELFRLGVLYGNGILRNDSPLQGMPA